MSARSASRSHRPSALPMLLTGDSSLATDVSRLGTAAGTGLDVLSDPVSARPRWHEAPVVLVGADMLAAVVETAPPRRRDVHVVVRSGLPEPLFRAALALGADGVVELPSGEGWLVETLLDATDARHGSAVVLGVMGGCGGAGATTFAAALAVVAAGDADATLLDTDRMGCGIEQVVGLRETAGAGWASVLQSAGRLGSRSLRDALPRRGGLAVLGWGGGERVELRRDVVREVLDAAVRGSALVVVDLPRYLDDACAEALVRCDHLVVVTRLSLAAVAATGRLLPAVLPMVPQAHLVARGPVTALEPERVAEALGLSLAAVMSDQRRLEESVALGAGPLPTRRGPLVRAARSTIARVSASGARSGVSA